jgi:hypothetical protein
VHDESGTVAINIQVHGIGWNGQVQFFPVMEISNKIASYGIKEVCEQRKGNDVYAFILAILVMVQGDIWPFCRAVMSFSKFSEVCLMQSREVNPSQSSVSWLGCTFSEGH